jgi:beta-phosphoglucomutase-like phosphatase (HAD superfamily)
LRILGQVRSTKGVTNIRALIFDYDGVVLGSERAKAAGWAIAALFIDGKLPVALFDRLSDGDSASASEAYRWITERRPDALEAIINVSGLSRRATCRAVWESLLSAYEGPLTESDLAALRESIKDPLVRTCSLPIRGTLDLIQTARWRLALGLVTQAFRKDVEDQAKHFAIPLNAFEVAEFCGGAACADEKATSYARACERLGVSSSEVLVFEDSLFGLQAATSANLACIALREPHNHQDLSLARLEVDDLGKFAHSEVIELLRTLGRDDALTALREYI